MILSFPLGNYHGWGVCGKYLSLEFNKLYNKFEHIYHYFNINDFDDLLELQYFLENFKTSNHIFKHKKTLFAMANHNFLPNNIDIKLKTKDNFGYIFFENILDKQYIKKASQFYKRIFCGSSYNEEILNNIYNIKNTKTILQGIDKTIFNTQNNEKIFNKDKFIIFSGGKFEYRKSQDIVLSAFKKLQDKYDDVLLVASWFNIWDKSIDTMTQSKHILVDKKTSNQTYYEYIKAILIKNKINPKKVLLYPLMPNKMMASVYKNSDIGIFPNRCEGGTNLVMMEYMACGKPIIASCVTGHKDIVNSKNAILLENYKKDINYNNWYDLDVDELYQKLEFAYLNYHNLKNISIQAGSDLSYFSWYNTAKNFKKAMKL